MHYFVILLVLSWGGSYAGSCLVSYSNYYQFYNDHLFSYFCDQSQFYFNDFQKQLTVMEIHIIAKSGGDASFCVVQTLNDNARNIRHNALKFSGHGKYVKQCNKWQDSGFARIFVALGNDKN